MLAFVMVWAMVAATLAADESARKDIPLKYWISLKNGTSIRSEKICNLDRQCTIYQDADGDRGLIISVTFPVNPDRDPMRIHCIMKHRRCTPLMKVSFYAEGMTNISGSSDCCLWLPEPAAMN
jgi:hypothetical protein